MEGFGELLQLPSGIRTIAPATGSRFVASAASIRSRDVVLNQRYSQNP
jgi:hypothetical protein